MIFAKQDSISGSIEASTHNAFAEDRIHGPITPAEKAPEADKKITAAVGKDGYLTFAGLSEGEYTLEETKTPDGYNTINPIKIVITYQNGKFTVKWKQTNENNEVIEGTGSRDDVIVDDQDNTFSTEILNKKGSLLPSTGGIGTTIFYIVGGILVVGAAILLVTKKRMSREA